MHIGIVGLGFGRAFAPIYRDHPLVDCVTLCDTDSNLTTAVARETGIDRTARSFEELLDDPTVDAIHLVTPLPAHAQQTLQVIQAGKHCACAVTMGNTLEELRSIVSAVQDSGLVYMMMETGVYTREFLYAKELQNSGGLGAITLLRGDYFQDLEAAYPAYWRSVPPMHYATHTVAPLLALAGTRAKRVACRGGGSLRKDICDDPANPFPLQSAMFELEGLDAAMHVDRAWYQTAHQYVESFSVYGDRMGFEWQQLDHEDPVVYKLDPVQDRVRWRGCGAKRVGVPYRPDLFPPELAPYTEGGHGGSHPHLVHEFVSAVVDQRKAAVDEVTAANWCAAGLCAHQSSLKGGEWVPIPDFEA